MIDRGVKRAGADKLWAPWRQKVMLGPQPKGCIFCRMPRSKADRKNYVLKRSPLVFTMLNLYPYNNGHVMVAPYRHVADPDKLTPAESKALMQETFDTVALLKKKLRPEGFNIGMNLGKTSGASFAGHLHMHIVPRWNGDTNFMPATGGTKVISESLDDLYRRLEA